MTPLVPIMLFGWVPLTVILFFSLKPHRAVLFAVIGGWLLLPVAGYNLPGLPVYSKSTAIALGLILGGRLSGQRQKASFAWRIYDLPMVLWCLSPLITSITNDLGWYDGLSGSFGHFVGWLVPYLAGRIYFNTSEKLRDLCLGIIIGGIVYGALCLYEIRMSPQLSKIFYGFFPHDWIQHKRYGGWRPIVFMQHGLMVALWMAISSTVAFWFWRSRDIKRLLGMPMSFIVMALVITALLCKSANGWFFLALGCCGYFMRSRYKLFLLLLLLVPLYMGLRISGFVSLQNVEMVASSIFDAERVGSLTIRLLQEDLFVQKAMGKPLFGWGGYSRGWPIDPETGKKMIRMVDALWIIIFSSKGFFGLVSLMSSILIGPWIVLRSFMKKTKELDLDFMPQVVLSLIVILFMIDCLVNAMVNPIYIMTSGALVGCYLAQKQEDHGRTAL